MKSKDDCLKWFPLWRDKWIFGSTRIELQHDERAIWVDFMALASMDSGFIRANTVTAYLVPQLAGLLCCKEELLLRSIKRFLETEKIKETDSGIYYLLNWQEFQLGGRQRRRIEAHAREISARADAMAGKSDAMSETAALNIDKIRLDKSIKRIGQKNSPDDFSLFWSSYPKKVKKQNALKQWEKIKEKPAIEMIIDALNKQITCREQLQQDGKFCPEWQDPERWIKNRRWEDEMEVQDGKPPTDVVAGRLWEIEQRRKNRNGTPDKNS